MIKRIIAINPKADAPTAAIEIITNDVNFKWSIYLFGTFYLVKR